MRFGRDAIATASAGSLEESAEQLAKVGSFLSWRPTRAVKWRLLSLHISFAAHSLPLVVGGVGDGLDRKENRMLSILYGTCRFKTGQTALHIRTKVHMFTFVLSGSLFSGAYYFGTDAR